MGNWLSDRMDTNCPATLDDVKQEVSDYLQAVPHDTYRKVRQNFGVRINASLNRGGAHIEYVNYKDFVLMSISDLGLSTTRVVTN